MTNKKAIYETILTEHRRITNEISDIKANSYELNDEEKKRVRDLQNRQIQLMNQMKILFNGNFGK
jgi:hypothetical protein